MPYCVIVTDDQTNPDETSKRVRATRQTFARDYEAQAYADTCAQSRNPQVVPAGSEYTELAWDFLKRNGLDFRAVLVGSDCPMHCEDAENERGMDEVNTFPRRTHIHGKHYRCTISGKDRGHVTFEFWNSYADEEFNAFRRGEVSNSDNRYWDKYRGGRKHGNSHEPQRKVTPYDLLACLQKYDPGTFKNFCGDFGYDADSRKADITYHAVVKEWTKVQMFFTAVELAEIQEIN